MFFVLFSLLFSSKSTQTALLTHTLPNENKFIVNGIRGVAIVRTTHFVRALIGYVINTNSSK